MLFQNNDRIIFAGDSVTDTGRQGVLGDGKYGINRSDRAEGYSHQALYSYRVAFSEGHDDGPLASLAGRHFSIPMEDIYFAEPFLRAGLIPFKGDSLHVQ